MDADHPTVLRGPDGTDQPSVGKVAHQHRDPGVGTLEEVGQVALDQALPIGGADLEEEVVRQGAEVVLGERMSHQQLRMPEPAAEHRGQPQLLDLRLGGLPARLLGTHNKQL